MSATKLSIIGRERALLDELTKSLQEMLGGPPPPKRLLAYFRRRHLTSAITPTPRGNRFEVMLADPESRDGQTGHIVRVTVELDRFEEQR